MPVVYNNLPRIAAQVRPKTEVALAKAAFDTQIAAIKRAPVDTGNLASSLVATRTGDLRWQVTAHAEYAIYVEMGTRKMAAQPYLLPSLQEVWPSMMQALRNVGIGAG